jgi:hypothetical protein
MVRIEHCVWYKGPEAAMRWGCRAKCVDSSSPDASIHWVINNGLSDEKCMPYSNSNTPETPCADQSGRSVRLVTAGYKHLPRTPQPGQSPAANNIQTDTNHQAIKAWLDLCGPVGVLF